MTEVILILACDPHLLLLSTLHLVEEPIKKMKKVSTPVMQDVQNFSSPVGESKLRSLELLKK
jgi:hypothetical protein